MSNKACCLLFIVSAPSGTGKTTVVERLVKVTDRLKLSRSYTSRAPRGDEADGVDYNFVSRARFEAMIANGEFLEHADVFGNLYGTHAGDTDALPRERRRRGAGDRRAGRAEGARAPACRTSPSSCCRRPTRCSRSGFAAAARTATRRCAGGSRWRAKRCRRSRSTITSCINDELESCVERIKVDRAGGALEARSACGPKALEILKSFNVMGLTRSSGSALRGILWR